MYEDSLTRKEGAWLDSLERLLDRQPENIRIMVTDLSLNACRPATIRAFFNEHGNVDNVHDLWSLQHGGKFQPCSESI